MKKSINVILILLYLTSCTDEFLETEPRGLIVAKTASDFRLFLDNADSRYTNNLSQVSGFVDVVSDDSQLDSVWFEWDRDRLHARQLYAFESDVWLPDGPSGDVVWKQNYYVSTLVSNILEEIHRADDNVNLQQQLIGEARVHRAYAYLTLVNVYAKHYNSATASSDLGVPLIGNPVQLPSLERATVQAVYNFILNELLASIDNLPEDIQKPNVHRPTQVAAYAILARTYLYMGNYEKALEYANKSLEIRDFLYNYNDIYAGLDRAENVIGISRTSDEEMLLFKTTTKSSSLDQYMKLDVTTFNDLYSGYADISDTETENYDLRRTLWFDDFNSEGRPLRSHLTYVFSDAFHRYSVDADGLIDYIPVATPEMYLTRAESNARLGNLQAALDDINKIRMHRYKTGTYTALTLGDVGNTKEAVLEEVLLERRRELYGKELRLFDVKRLGLPVVHSLRDDENAFSVPANDPKLVWPIHNTYIGMNPEMEQNPR